MAMLIVFLISIQPTDTSAQITQINDGAAWLKTNQNPSGSWGAKDGTEFRDTLVVADILKKISETGMEYVDAINFISDSEAVDVDFLSRKAMVFSGQGADVATEISSLLSMKNTVETDASYPNYPEGGWGPSGNYATSCLDTALALSAISQEAVPKGLSASNISILSGETHTFYLEYPADTSNFSILISDLSGNIDFRIYPGESEAYNYWGNLTSPTYLGTGSLSIEPGTRKIEIYANADSQYSFQISLTSNGYDSSVMTDPIAYLVNAQNTDGGWGISRGSDSDLFITAKVLITLQQYIGSHDLGDVVDAGLVWLKARQNADGGFGLDGGSAYETAVGYIALAEKSLLSAESQSALAWIIGAQESDGSWNHEAYDTAVSMLALYTSLTETDADGDGVPDPVDNCPGYANAQQTDTDLDGIGDACDDDDDGDGLSDEDEINLTGTNPLLKDSDSDGILDGEEDRDFDGIMNSDEILLGTDPGVPDVQLTSGLNLFGYPVSIPPGYTSYDLLSDLGTEDEILKLQRFNEDTGVYETTAYQEGVAGGDEFDIAPGQGYLVYVKKGKRVSFSGVLNSVPILLNQGFNLISLPGVPAGYTSYDLLSLIGDENIVSSIQRLNPETGAFETSAYESGVIAGVRFNLINTEAYILHMKTGAAIPGLLRTPVIAITSISDGDILESSSVTVSGTISDPLATVTVNGVPAVIDADTFSATDVPLVSGTNTITAKALSTDNMTGFDTVTVTLEEGADYEISKGGSVSGTRSITAAADLMSQVASYSQSVTGLPAGVTYSLTGILGYSTEVEISFAIEVSGAAAEGIYEFQVEYQLYDSGGNPLAPLINNVFEFKIKILP